MRAPGRLSHRYQGIFCYVGQIILMVGLLMLTPLLAIFARPEEFSLGLGFLCPGLALASAGLALWFILRSKTANAMTIQEGGVIVVLSWILVCLVSAWPFIAILKFNFTQALFESVSGWTTTGLSVVDVARAPHVILLWRSIMQLAGGAGLAIIMLAALAGPMGTGLYVAEGRGEQLVAHVRASAKIVITIYTGYALAGAFAYWVAGMSPFDAINHSFAAVSTGGFSTRVESIGYWDSGTVEMVTMVLMILGNLNFLTAYLLLHGRLKAVYRNGEVRLMAILIPVSAFLVFFFTCRDAYPALTKGIRTAVFETVSALTTTGFTTTDYYAGWGPFGFLVLIILMLIGGGTCSTAGGIKQYRVFVLGKAVFWDVRRFFLPRTAVIENYIWQGERKDFIDDARIARIATFVFIYLVTFAIGASVIAAYGYDIKESLFEFASALGTVGLSIGITGSATPPPILWVEIIGMFLGRLEFFVIFIGIAKIMRDARSIISR